MKSYRLLTTVLPNLPHFDDRIAQLVASNNFDDANLEQIAESIRALRVLEHQSPTRPMLYGRASGRLVLLSSSGDFIHHDIDAKSVIGRVNPDILMFNDIEYDERLVSHDLQKLVSHFETGYIFGGEFIRIFNTENAYSKPQEVNNPQYKFFGNVILSRIPLTDPFRIQLDLKSSFSNDDQAITLGYHNAIGAKIEIDERRIWLVNAHLSCESPNQRQIQVRKLIDAIDNHIGLEPVIIGGNFNTTTLPVTEDMILRTYYEPFKSEPLFDDFLNAGFDWRDANTAEATNYLSSMEYGERAIRQKWFFVRGLKCSDASTLQVNNADGKNLSSENAIRVSIKPLNGRIIPKRNPLLSIVQK